MSTFMYKPITRGRLPHLAPAGRTLFITSRLAGSLPQELLRQYKQKQESLNREVDRIRRLAKDDGDPAMRQWLLRFEKFKQEWFVKFDRLMDRAEQGPTWLKDERVASVVTGKLHEADGQAYRLDAYCVMSNHLHIVFAPLVDYESLAETVDDNGNLQFESEYPDLAKIMKQFKGSSARACNLLLERTGTFWERESFDHVIRSGRFMKAVRYVLNNPVKANLVRDWRDWPWSYCREELVERL